MKSAIDLGARLGAKANITIDFIQGRKWRFAPYAVITQPDAIMARTLAKVASCFSNGASKNDCITLAGWQGVVR